MNRVPLPGHHPFARPRAHALAWLALLAWAVCVYAMGLDGQYIPNNGDELVYAHIARLTANSGHWLPLVSALDNMRNTKPPGLFWQAIVATGWGQHWQMWVLRLPSLIYTLLITGAIAWSVHGITRNIRTALVAACVYLGFFCSFRYGRPFLTSAPETFWLGLPLFALLWRHWPRDIVTQYFSKSNVQNKASTILSIEYLAPFSVAFCILTGTAWGLGAAYKSFALIAPAAAALWCAALLVEPRLQRRAVVQITVRVFGAAILGLCIFALWFALDPDPAAVWHEFVIGENAGKMVDKQGYWHEALHGGDSSLWAQLLAYVQNAGLLAFVVLGLAWLGLKNLGKLRAQPPHVYILLAWVVVWLVVFSIPSQRSARYVIPAMPAVAMLIALYWDRIGRGWFLLSLGFCGLMVVVLGRIAWVAHDLRIGTGSEFALALVAAALGLAAVMAGLLKSHWTRACTVASSIAVYACFNATVAPLDGPQGRYPVDVSTRFSNARLAVPSDFNAQFERFGFLLPDDNRSDNRFTPYDVAMLADPVASTARLNGFLNTFDAVIWAQADSTEPGPACLPGCKVLASRWTVKGRHKPGEINLANVGYPQNWLFSREWLVVRGGEL